MHFLVARRRLPETPKNPVSRVGDIWTLGKHRLMCGDATNPEHVERLLDGSEPDLMVTDPQWPPGHTPVGNLDQLSRSDFRIFDVMPFTTATIHAFAGAVVTVGSSEIFVPSGVVSEPAIQ